VPLNEATARPAAARGRPRSNQVSTIWAAAWYNASQTRAEKLFCDFFFYCLCYVTKPPKTQFKKSSETKTEKREKVFDVLERFRVFEPSVFQK
jgi:hypothetical protein